MVNCDVNGKWDSTHLGINIGSHATMGHIVKIVDIGWSLHPSSLAHFVVTKPIIVHGC
jgi:hypothetical protein